MSIFNINEKKVVLGTVGALAGASIMFGGVVAAGVTTGLFSALGVGMVLVKAKDKFPRVWKWIIDEPLLPDLIISVSLTILMSSATATGIIAGASAGLFVSAGLFAFKHISSSASCLI